jgi:ComF family protein
MCGHKSPFGVTHQACRTPDGLDGLITCTPYKEPLSRKLVELMKYHYIADIAPILGGLVAEEILHQEMAGYFSGFTVIPLPLHKTREKWRGYNQAQLMATAMARQIETGGGVALPVKPHCLIRVRKTKVQAELADAERAANVMGAFLAPNSVPERIILVDDVSTTRSTLKQACAALKKSGAQEVWAVAFAQG